MTEPESARSSLARRLTRLPWWLPFPLAALLFADALCIGSQGWYSGSTVGSIVADAIYARPHVCRVSRPLVVIDEGGGVLRAMDEDECEPDVKVLGYVDIWQTSGRSGFWAPTRAWTSLRVWSYTETLSPMPDDLQAPAIGAAAEYWASVEGEHAWRPRSWSAGLQSLAGAMGDGPLEGSVRTPEGRVRAWSPGWLALSRSRAIPEGVVHSAMAAVLGVVLLWSVTFGRPWLSAADAIRSRSRRRRGECPSCGYGLAGLMPTARCPECGAPREPDYHS